LRQTPLDHVRTIFQELAKTSALRPARNRHQMAQEGIPSLLEMEKPPTMVGKKKGSMGYS
jgi:hypothetical protein